MWVVTLNATNCEDNDHHHYKRSVDISAFLENCTRVALKVTVSHFDCVVLEVYMRAIHLEVSTQNLLNLQIENELLIVA